jgi:hypothetical protein
MQSLLPVPTAETQSRRAFSRSTDTISVDAATIRHAA